MPHNPPSSNTNAASIAGPLPGGGGMVSNTKILALSRALDPVCYLPTVVSFMVVKKYIEIRSGRHWILGADWEGEVLRGYQIIVLV